MERGGRVIARIVPDTKAATLMPHVIDHVMPRSTVFTHEALSYDPLTGSKYGHKRVHPAAKVYVEGDVHVNSLEGFWSVVSAASASIIPSLASTFSRL